MSGVGAGRRAAGGRGRARRPPGLRLPRRRAGRGRHARGRRRRARSVIVALALVIIFAFGLHRRRSRRSGSATARRSRGCSPCCSSSCSCPRWRCRATLIEQDWFRTIATYNPVSYLLEGIRSLFIVGWDGEALALAFGCAIGDRARCSSRSPPRNAAHAGWCGHEVRAAWRWPWPGATSTTSSPTRRWSIPAVMFPLFFFTAFAGGLSSIADSAGLRLPLRLHRVPVRRSCCSRRRRSAACSPASAIARDFESGFGRRLMLAAPNRLAHPRRLRAGGARAHGVHLGDPHGGRAGWWACRSAAARSTWSGSTRSRRIVNFAAIMWSSGIALRFRSFQAAPLMQTPTFLILFLAPVYVPLDLLTGWVQAAASVNPLTAVLEAEREPDLRRQPRPRSWRSARRWGWRRSSRCGRSAGCAAPRPRAVEPPRMIG